MSSNYQNILQIIAPADDAIVIMAHKCCHERFLRLTARGPLKFFRHDLLAAADRALRVLKKPRTFVAPKPMSLLARRVAASPRKTLDNKPARSDISSKSILTGRPLEINARLLQTTPKEQALTEDRFCCEILYRIEGDLIRFDSRQELLDLAGQWKIPLFRANMLIAQIVQSVRHYQLYQPTDRERQLNSQLRNMLKNRHRADPPGGQGRLQWLIITGIMIVFTVIVEIFLLLSQN
ncbi:MAG: hypothetical protein K9M57_01630 [Phycisphaerae bacterium]|nr:hypothetical protein [Phycisphaerae bacterium]